MPSGSLKCATTRPSGDAQAHDASAAEIFGACERGFDIGDADVEDRIVSDCARLRQRAGYLCQRVLSPVACTYVLPMSSVPLANTGALPDTQGWSADRDRCR